jgi:hypothetical protein
MTRPFRKVSRMSSMNFLSGFFFKVGNGTSVRFWEDVWMGHLPLSQQYPTLYNMVQHKNVLISTVLATARWIFLFEEVRMTKNGYNGCISASGLWQLICQLNSIRVCLETYWFGFIFSQVYVPWFDEWTYYFPS